MTRVDLHEVEVWLGQFIDVVHSPNEMALWHPNPVELIYQTYTKSIDLSQSDSAAIFMIATKDPATSITVSLMNDGPLIHVTDDERTTLYEFATEPVGYAKQ